MLGVAAQRAQPWIEGAGWNEHFVTLLLRGIPANCIGSLMNESRPGFVVNPKKQVRALLNEIPERLRAKPDLESAILIRAGEADLVIEVT